MTEEQKAEELSAEQKEGNEEMDKLTAYLRNVVDKMYAEGFLIAAIDSASDVFKSLCIIKSAQTKEWEDHVIAGRKLVNKFYDYNSKDLHYVEKTDAANEEVKA